MDLRPHASHAGAANDPVRADTLPADSPSHLLHADSDEVKALLEELDDVVFQAVRGDKESLQLAHQLWPEVVKQIGWELVEESREQYLRYATDLARRFEQDAIRDPQKALAVIEIIELLTRG
jgi:hypothetical protein